MESLSKYLDISHDVLEKILLSLSVFVILSITRLLFNLIIRKRFDDIRRVYTLRRVTLYTYIFLLIFLIGPIWIKSIQSITTFLGLASAGIAIAMHDTIANIAGWLFIVTIKPFKSGDRVQIGDTAGDVIDIRLLQFSMIEIGNWVDGDQSTGRIVHVPNSKILREPLANYQIGFEYIWNEIPVLITFESNWKKAKQIMMDVAEKDATHLSDGAQAQLRRAAERFLIFYGKLTPIVYTSVKASGILLTYRYLVNPRQRRTSEQTIWEATLNAFDNESDIDLAYNTTRIFTRANNPIFIDSENPQR